MYKKICRYMRLNSLFTLILCTLLVASVSFTTFDRSIKNELKTEASILRDVIEKSENKEALISSVDFGKKQKHIVLITKDKSILYDNKVFEEEDNYLDTPEVKSAFENSEGERQKYYFTFFENTYFYAVKLEDGSVLRTADKISNGIFVFRNIFLTLLFMLILIYILCINVSSALTKNIIAPLESLYSFDGETYPETYPELHPFFKKIIGQNKEIRRQMEKSRLRKLRLQLISDNMNEGLLILDKSGNVLSFNDCMLNILKCEAISKEDLEADKKLFEAITNALDKKKSSIVWKKDDNTYRVFYSPVCENDDLKGVLLLFFDSTEIEQAQRIRKEFSANVSHELKTPLTAIKGYAQIINNDIARKEDIKNFTEKIEKESIRLINLIDDIIKLSRLDENVSDEGEKQSISLMSVCGEVMDTLRSEAKKKNISLSLCGTDSVINANISQITQIVYNLCDNAIKYNVENGKVEVLVSDKQLIVKDTGIGIPPESIPRIFERFFRVDKSHSKKVNGTGLGLSIVKHAAILNNADIKVESNPSEGSVFTVTFSS